ncbi:hypothetical protein JHK87_004474 [Glycine soja]|nr:hypothetical protein JHK87_004474 [Glycine soja]
MVPKSLTPTRNAAHRPLIFELCSDIVYVVPISWHCTPLNAKPSFIVRANFNVKGYGEATEDVPSDDVDEVSKGKGEQVLDSEAPKSPRKP